MALPDDVAVITLTGTYLDMQGNPQSGSVSFVPSTGPFEDPVDEVIFEPVTVNAALNGSGHFSVVLPCTSNAFFEPSSWAWEVTERVTGSAVRTYFIELPSSLGSAVDISAVAQAESGPAFTGYVPVTGGAMSGALVLEASPPIQVPSGSFGEVLGSDSSGNITLGPLVLTDSSAAIWAVEVSTSGALSAQPVMQAQDGTPADDQTGGPIS